jgi:glyoxylase-like metal-dependent hydrolase (beta-lactamase superfamily II)
VPVVAGPFHESADATAWSHTMIERIHVYAAPADKFFVNSFLIETATGVVVVDTQFLVSSARALRSRLDALRKPLAGVVITHPHPDHFNGLPILLEGLPPTPVYATKATIAGVAATQAAKRAAWTPVYGADYPPTDSLPDHEVSSDATLILDLGPGESSDITVIHLQQVDALIASDLIYNECHPWLAEHRSREWLDQLEIVAGRFSGVERVYPGHGPAGGPELFARQRDYIQTFQKLVAANVQDGHLSDTALATIREATMAGRSGWPLEGLIDMNAKAVAEELVLSA